MLQTSAPIRVLLIHDDPREVRLLRLLLQTADPNGFEVAHVCELTDAELLTSVSNSSSVIRPPPFHQHGPVSPPEMRELKAPT